MNLKRLIYVMLCIFMLNLVYADAPPPFMSFKGTVKMGGIDAPIGTLIEAFIVGDNDPSLNDGFFSVDTTGNYDLPVTGNVSDINKVIIFHIDGVKANENSTFLPMGYETLDLSIDSCIETWSCTEWSSCDGGTQTRTCTDICGNDTKNESQSCSTGGGSTGGSSGGGGGGGGGGDTPKKPAISTVAPPPRPIPMPAKPKEEEKLLTSPTSVETPPPVAPAEQITAPTPGIAGVTGAAIIGATYQERPFTMGMLTVFILLIIGLFIYSHAKTIKNWPFHFKFKKKRWVVLMILILVIFVSLFTHFVLLNYFRSAS